MSLALMTVAIVLRSFLSPTGGVVECEEAVDDGMCCFDFYVPERLEQWLVLSEVLSKLSVHSLCQEKLIVAQRRNKKEKYSSSESEFLIKQRGLCYAL